MWRNEWSPTLSLYEQISDKSCGSASLHVVYEALGLGDVGERQIRQELGVSNHGYMTWRDLANHAKIRNVETKLKSLK